MAREKNWTGKKEPRVRTLEAHDGGLVRKEPASDEAEQHVLACCLLEESGGDSIARLLNDKVSGGAFHAPAHRMIFEAITELYRQGQRVSLQVLAEELTSRRHFEAVGGFPMLIQITGKVPTAAHFAYFVAKLKEKWILRELIRDASDAIEQAYDFTSAAGDTELEDLLEPLANRFNRAVDYSRSGQETMTQRADSGYKRILLKLDGKQDRSRQLFTGMKEFDERFGAFDVLEEEWLIGVAASPSIGKSALTRKWADCFLAAGKKGIAFPLETGIAKWLELSAATACRINARTLDNLPPDKADQFRQALAIRRGWIGERLWVYDDPIKAETLLAKVEDHVRQLGPVDFVVVDHLHELYSSSNKFRGQREQELGFIAKELKKTAKRLNIPFFVPTQLNRSSNKDGISRRPTMSDIRGSGEIEAAYDRLLVLHVPKEDMRGSEQTENQTRVMMEIIQAKSRNGPKGHREFWFDRPFTDFVDIRDHEFERKPNTPGGTANPGGYKR